MSIRELKKKKLESIQQSLNQCSEFRFSENLMAAFDIHGERTKSNTHVLYQHAITRSNTLRS